MEIHKPESLIFLYKFLHNSKSIATVAPSSKALALAGTKFISAEYPQNIIELGAGTGAVTKIAIKKMHPSSTYIAFENDPELAALLKEHCPEVKIVIADAKDIAEELDKINMQRADVLISCLPFFLLAPSTAINILESWKKLTINNKKAPFCQQTLIPWYYWKRYKQLFNHVDFKLVWNNIPPGGFYYCWELLDDFKEKIRVQHNHSSPY